MKNLFLAGYLSRFALYGGQQRLSHNKAQVQTPWPHEYFLWVHDTIF